MLKKFKRLNNFFHPEVNKIDMNFSPFAMTVNGKVLQVMQATDNDIPALLVLEKAVYSGHTPWSSFSFESELKKRKNSLYLVVYQASTLVAFIGARFHPREAHITNIAVAPDYQGQHIGRRLLELMIDRARKNESECVSLEVKIDNDVAKRLYESIGFEATFIRKNYYQDTHTDAVNMILWLKPHQIKRRKLTF
ncbi:MULTISPECIES: ribosomal protein S18-alanine N-acetyltransferase [Lactobacillus]|uniref:Ribosomal-protein-alanine N-acetyltransferase n=1 Tax=Lactobacillus xujianguonis TaxID=2495899 RepID=A0A437SWV2_9LACO|nr:MULTISPECIES: ribosomal protein S18-alanine N-acetyltransferase [Lactobacillus]RVU71389.1 ribosomal-protein-alanine N-acetyltransferase [Lactobacillus xujianguonis]RVU76950.1 ribosomal-protein-alanine N-acetyltransferase [Lactobacillus xujianguonis]